MSYTDPCINSVGTTQTVISNAGATDEAFGMCAFAIDTSSGTTSNLSRDAEYDGACDNTATNGYAWDESGSADDLASSSTVVDDEMLELDFAALSEVTTPTGSYQVVATFIGTSQF